MAIFNPLHRRAFNDNQFFIGLFVLFLILSWGLYRQADRPFAIPARVAQKIGCQIWHNECGKKIEGLTAWNKGEEFASLGIGHFIWHPRSYQGPFKQTFPDFLSFIKEKNVLIPLWLESSAGCPWQSLEEFHQAFNGAEMTSLRRFLAETVDLQIMFMVHRLETAFFRLSRQLPTHKKSSVIKQFYRLASSPAGLYALLDYLNFKGEGLSSKECYQGKGWGLSQVLESMPGNTEDPVKEFADQARHVLTRRVKHSPPERNEQCWLQGWLNRIETYLSFSI